MGTLIIGMLIGMMVDTVAIICIIAYFAGSENTREKLIDKACKWWEVNH